MDKNHKFLTSKLTMTSNNLLDIINWLKLGAYVIIHNDNNSRFFHECTKENISEDEADKYINNHRFIYVNVSKLPGLLDDGEWNWYIQDAGFDECKCSIKNKVSHTNLILPHREQLCLGI